MVPIETGATLEEDTEVEDEVGDGVEEAEVVAVTIDQTTGRVPIA